MDRLSPNRSDTPANVSLSNAQATSHADFQTQLKDALKEPTQHWPQRFKTLLNHLSEVRLADRAEAANQLVSHTYYLGNEEQMMAIAEIINIIDQTIEDKDPAVKESIALNLEQEIATATDLSYAPTANVYPLYSLMMRMAQHHGLSDFATALALRMVARLKNAPPYQHEAEFNAAVLMIPQCPPELQAAFVAELFKLLPQDPEAKIVALEKMKENTSALPATAEIRRTITVPIAQKLFQARLDKAAAESNL